MKQIIMDFLRRWFGAYLLAVLFVAAMLVALDLEAGFTFVGILMLPFAFELGRRPFGVMVTLPVSRRIIAVSYWCVGVLLPVLLMAGIVALDALLFRSFAVSSKSATLILFGSLAFAGSGFCLFTFISQDDRESNPGNFLVICLGTLWFLSTMYGIFHQRVLNVTLKSPVVYIVGLIGLLLTVLGYVRSEKLVAGRARKRPDGKQHFVRTRERITSPRPGMARFGGVFFDVVRSGFLMGLLYAGLLLVFKLRISVDNFVLAYVFAFGGLMSFGLLSGGMRLLRSLPLSVGQLALRLSLMPLLAILGIIAGLAVIQWIKPVQFLIHYPASLMFLCAGAVCVANSFMVRYSGRDGLYLAMLFAALASAVIFNTVSNVKWPAAFWWLLGLSMMAGAFFLNRHWLRSSYSYRPSTGDFSRLRR